MLNKASTPNYSKKALYRVMSHIRGRIRYRISGLLKNVAYQQTFKQFFESLPGVTQVRINPLAESIILNFSEKHLSSADIEQNLVTVIQQLTSIKSYSLKPAKNTNSNPPQQFLKATTTSENRGLAEPNQLNQSSLAKKTENKVIQEIIPHNPVLNSSSFLSAHPIEEKTPSYNGDVWLSQCQEQAKTIKLLEQQLADLFSKAAIGSNLLNKWHLYRSNNLNPENSSTLDSNLLCLETLESQKNWQPLAIAQAQKIAQLQQQITEQQRLSAFADFHLNKWQKRFFSSSK